MNTVTITFTKEEVTELINAVFYRDDSHPGEEIRKLDRIIGVKLIDAYSSFPVERKKK